MNNLKKAGLYIHVPFCSKKCNYCDFYSLRADDSLKEAYVHALVREIRSKSTQYNDRVIDTVYIGGGTPTSLGTELLCTIIDAVTECFKLMDGYEFTIETNPGIEADFAALRACGANRLSIGLQSANMDELRLLGRIHSTDDYLHTLSAARSAGFDNVSADIMFSLPSQTLDKLSHTLDFVIASAPEHISAYSLKIEPGTPFFSMRKSFKLPDEDTDADMYLCICERLKKAGYGHYEISNFAKRGYHSRHNLRYWRCREYLGFGPGAHSYIDGIRYAYVRDLKAVTDVYALGKGYEDILSECSFIDAKELINEALMLGLRLSEGVDDRILRKFAPLELIYKKLDPLIKGGLVIKRDNGIALSDKGMYVSNAVIGYINDIQI